MVDNVNPVAGAGAGAHARKLKKAYVQPEVARGTDAVQISSDVMRVKNAEGIRMEKVLEVKRAIANGTYLTDEKLDRALDRAIDDARVQA